MKNKLLLGILFCISFLLAQEQTLEDFLKISQKNLKKYSLAELMGLDPVQDKKYFFLKVSQSYYQISSL